MFLAANVEDLGTVPVGRYGLEGLGAISSCSVLCSFQGGTLQQVHSTQAHQAVRQPPSQPLGACCTALCATHSHIPGAELDVVRPGQLYTVGAFEADLGSADLEPLALDL